MNRKYGRTVGMSQCHEGDNSPDMAQLQYIQKEWKTKEYDSEQSQSIRSIYASVTFGKK